METKLNHRKEEDVTMQVCTQRGVKREDKQRRCRQQPANSSVGRLQRTLPICQSRAREGKVDAVVIDDMRQSEE